MKLPARTLGPRGLFAFVAIPVFITSLQFHMVSVGLSDMIEDLNAPLRWVGWVITIFTVASAAAQPIMGKLSDEYGRRPVFVAGLTTFALASLACALAPNVYVLIAARVFQGAAAGSLMPSAYGLIAEAFADSRARALGLISSVLPIGTLVGPTLGGVIVEEFGWRMTFALNIPIGLGLALGAMVLLPASNRENRTRSRIDVFGAVLLSVAIFALVYGLTELGQRDQQPDTVIVGFSMISAMGLFIWFLRHEVRTPEPIVDLQLLKQRAFFAANTLNLLYGVALLGLFGFIPLYAQTAYGMSASESGIMLTPRALAMLGMSTLAAFLLPVTGYRKPIAAGLTLMAIGAAILSLGLHEPAFGPVRFSDFIWLSSVVTIVGLAYGLVGPALNNAAIELAPDKIAAISGLRGMFRSLGGAVGTAIIVVVVSRAPTTPQGIETAFIGLAVVTLLAVGLAWMIPEPSSPGGGSTRIALGTRLRGLMARRRARGSPAA